MDIDKFKVDDPRLDFLFSLSKMLNGKKIVDVLGYASEIDGQMLFKVNSLVLDDGERIHLGGEHDFPYLEDIPGWEDEDLEKLK